MLSLNRAIVICVLVFVLGAVSAIGSDDPMLTVACWAVLTLTIGLLWRLGEPPILLFLPAGIQVTQVVTPMLYANWLGVPIQNVSIHIGDITAATWLALAAALSLVVGMWCGLLGMKTPAAVALEREARAWPPRTAFVFCMVTLVLAAMFGPLSELSDGLRQPAVAAARIQWVGIFVLACVCMTQWRGFGYLLIVTGLEVVRGFSGYFSDFRLVFFVLLVAIFSISSKFRPRNIIVSLTVGGTLLLMGIWWSAIKTEYRKFLDQGSMQQIVLVPFEDRIAFLLNKLVQFDGQTMNNGFERLVKRVGYVNYLSAVMRHVPSSLPFQDGAQIGETVMHVLQPRVLFPDKAPVPSDSEVLEKYTGFRWGASSGSGTSVGIGYVAELYVDFGWIGAVVGTFIMGVLVGLAFRYVCAPGSLPEIISYGLAVMLAMTLTQFDEALIKIVGSFVTTLAVVLVLRRILLPQLLTKLGLSDQRKVLAHATERVRRFH